MSFSLADLVLTSAAALLFTPILVPPGFLLAWVANPLQFRRATVAEQLLWSLTLSVPVALVLVAVLGRYLSPASLLLLFWLAALAAVAVSLRLRRRPSAPAAHATVRRHTSVTRLCVGGVVLLFLYVLAMTASLQVGNKLFECVIASDWSVRIPLVQAAIHTAVPPGNPFFSIDGRLAPPRYYFYWYTLCAQVGRMHLGSHQLPARACLSASVFWAALALGSTLALSLKYLAGVRRHRRETILLAFALCCVMGIDIIPSLGGLLTHPIHLRPEIEWWHQDRIPSFLGAILFAPHHIAGVVCCVCAFLLLHAFSVPVASGSGSEEPRRPARQVVSAVLLAGICFAAAAGDSTYIAFCFAFVGLLYGLDCVRQRRWLDVLALLGAGAFAVLLSLPFLHSMLSGPALPPPPGQAHSRFFSLTVRELGDGARSVGFVSRRLHHEITQTWLKNLLGLPFVAVSVPLEFGFFLIPLGLRIRTDWHRLRSGDPLTNGERILWSIFLGALIPALFISSEPTQGVNDLGRHAGLILRFVVVVWSAQLLFPYVERLRRHQPLAPAHPWTVSLATLLLALGVLTQAWQIVLDRTFLILFHHTRANPEMPFAKDTDLAGRYFDLRQGLERTEAGLPYSAAVQSNMGSRYQLIVMLYTHQPFAAGDVSCELAFGGNPAACYPTVRRLQALYGGPSDTETAPNQPQHTVFFRNARETTTSDNFVSTCHDLHLTQLVAQNTDPAWSLPESWVWQQQPVYATPLIRIFRCPGAPGT